MGCEVGDGVGAPIDKNLFFSHRACDYFPCHEGLAPERFNCLLCYCPLYTLGEACGGDFGYTDSGVKDCSACTVPHDGDSGVRLVRARFAELSALAAKHDGGVSPTCEDARPGGAAFCDEDPEEGLVLVLGGVASGKRSYARSLGFAEEERVFDAHELVREGTDARALADELASKGVVTCAEVGSGIVPIEAGERLWRENVGLLTQLLASRAHTVVRMVAGVPVVLKGRAPKERRELDGSLELVFIRHGQTPGNAARRHVGALDEPLSEIGRDQARQAGVHPEVPLVYVSKMRRACETASLMFPNARQVVVPGVEEMDFGRFGGRSADDMVDDTEYRAWVDGGCVGRCPGGESRDEFIDRICEAVERLCREASARGEQRVILVAHGGTMMASLFRLADERRDYYDWLVDNCGMRRVSVSVAADAPFAMQVIDDDLHA